MRKILFTAALVPRADSQPPAVDINVNVGLVRWKVRWGSRSPSVPATIA